jgi:Ca2+/H+ antiporter, TMEM165/GDT1 family
VLLLLLVWIAPLRAQDKDFFDIVDTNHDGNIDRTEFGVGIQIFQAELQHISLPSSSSWSAMMQPFWQSGEGYWKAFSSSVMMILATEIGDKTFFIAAILSMKHARSAVFAGAMAALVAMTVLSTLMGLILPKFLDRRYTHVLSGILFLYFGIKLLLDARQMQSGKVSEELEEVEEELLHSHKKKKRGEDEEDVEAAAPALRRSNSILSTPSVIFLALTLTFVAEWGDRSQIATIALASAKNPVGVTVGAIVGHCVCTASACVGGRMLAANIQEKTVSQCGGAIFLLFGLHSLFLET